MSQDDDEMAMIRSAADKHIHAAAARAKALLGDQYPAATFDLTGVAREIAATLSLGREHATKAAQRLVTIAWGSSWWIPADVWRTPLGARLAELNQLPPRPIYVSEAAALLRVSETRVRQLVQEGKLEAFTRSPIRINRASLLARFAKMRGEGRL